MGTVNQDARVRSGPRRSAVVAAALALAAVLAAVPDRSRAADAGMEPLAEPIAGCAPADHAGGEWPRYGHDLANTRTQPAEDVISPATVGDLELAWSHAAEGTVYNNTPVVADGCVYLAASDGTVSAHNADSGELLWSRQLVATPAAFGGGLVATPALDGERLFVIVNVEGAPYVQALDRRDGSELWQVTLDDQELAMSNSSPVVFDGMVFAGFSGHAGAGHPERGGYVLLDSLTGEVLAKRFVIPDDDFAEGYAGAGIWSTPAVDAADGHAYVGTSNPHSPQLEHERANSILKIDLDRTRSTFGDIVDHYKGLPDTYLPGLAEQPVCEAKPDLYYADRFSLSCLQIDLDFGASPTLFDADGQALVGDLQKAGVFHAVDRASMDGVWQTVVGVPCLACNAASPASVDGDLFTAAGPPGQLFRLGGADGGYAWAGSLSGATTYNPVTTANGVVYSVDGGGFLDAFDAATGVQVLKRNLSLDTGVSMMSASSSSGIAVARNTLYVAANGHVLAYRLPDGSSDPGGPALPEVPGLPAPPGGGGGRVVTGPGAVATTYTTPVAVVSQGSSLTYSNLDVAQHDVVSTDGLFSSPLIGLGQSTDVAGVPDLGPGQYGFYCTLHANMTGTLIVQ